MSENAVGRASRVLKMPNPITKHAGAFVGLYQQQGWPAAGSYYNRLNLPEQLKDQFRKEVDKIFKKKGMEVSVRI